DRARPDAGLVTLGLDEARDLDPGAQARLLQNVRDVTLHRTGRDEQPDPDLPVGQPVADQPGDPGLGHGQRAPAVADIPPGLTGAPAETHRARPREHAVPVADGSRPLVSAER